MKTTCKKDEKRHGRARSDGQIRDAMTKVLLPNKHLTKAIQQSIRGLEKNGFTARLILPVASKTDIQVREFRADFAKQTQTGLLVFSVRIDTDGNVTNPKP